MRVTGHYDTYEVTESQRRWARRMAKECVRAAAKEYGSARALVSSHVVDALVDSHALGIINNMPPTRRVGQAQALVEEIHELRATND